MRRRVLPRWPGKTLVFCLAALQHVDTTSREPQAVWRVPPAVFVGEVSGHWF